ncbi:MAG: secondary thiamine-phosphate synthase enzyme YjbQ [Pelolinea sp.]|nr:secondary thiamine-phosphate synthase enzyme YjbQ [Pelolinea sp.]
MYTEIKINTEASECLVNITEKIQQVVCDSKIKEGVCVVFIPHTTAGITINSAMDILTLKDIIAETHRLVPTRVDFNHIYDTPADAAGHIKSVLIGNSLTLIVKNGELVLGGSQSVLFFEFDGPRTRHVSLRVMGDSE